MAAAGPPLILGACVAGLLAAAPFGLDVVWYEHPLTLAEAAALRDAGMVARLIDRGQDPNRRSFVRGGIFSDAVYLTPLEAAVGARRLDIVELLLQSGANADGETRGALVCLALRVRANDIVDFLRATGWTPLPDCERVKMPW